MDTKQSSTPSFFNFLKEGVLLPARNWRLFVVVFAFMVAFTSLLYLSNDLAVQPITDKLNLDIKALNGTDPGSSEFAPHRKELQDDTRNLMLVNAAYLLFTIILGSIIRIIVLFATVTTFSGELITFREVLVKSKAQVKGPLVTLAFVYALEIAFVVLLAALVALLVFFTFKHYFGLVYVVAVFLLLAFIFLAYFSFLSSLSVVVAVAEPGCQGAAAVGRAWHMVKYKRRRAMLFIVLSGALAAVVSPVHTLARTWALSNMASGLLLEFLYAILIGAMELFDICVMTAFYYECKGSTEASVTGYAKVFTEEQFISA